MSLMAGDWVALGIAGVGGIFFVLRAQHSLISKLLTERWSLHEKLHEEMALDNKRRDSDIQQIQWKVIELKTVQGLQPKKEIG